MCRVGKLAVKCAALISVKFNYDSTWRDVTPVQEVSKELEEEVFANRQRFEHMSRSHDQQLKELQQVLPPLLLSSIL